MRVCELTFRQASDPRLKRERPCWTCPAKRSCSRLPVVRASEKRNDGDATVERRAEAHCKGQSALITSQLHISISTAQNARPGADLLAWRVLVPKS